MPPNRHGLPTALVCHQALAPDQLVAELLHLVVVLHLVVSWAIGPSVDRVAAVGTGVIEIWRVGRGKRDVCQEDAPDDASHHGRSIDHPSRHNHPNHHWSAVSCRTVAADYRSLQTNDCIATDRHPTLDSHDRPILRGSTCPSGRISTLLLTKDPRQTETAVGTDVPSKASWRKLT